MRVKYACADYRKQLRSENKQCNSVQGGLIMAVSSYYNYCRAVWLATRCRGTAWEKTVICKASSKNSTYTPLWTNCCNSVSSDQQCTTMHFCCLYYDYISFPGLPHFLASVRLECYEVDLKLVQVDLRVSKLIWEVARSLLLTVCHIWTLVNRDYQACMARGEPA